MCPLQYILNAKKPTNLMGLKTTVFLRFDFLFTPTFVSKLRNFTTRSWARFLIKKACSQKRGFCASGSNAILIVETFIKVFGIDMFEDKAAR